MADTLHLSRDEVGAYWLLLMTAWRRPSCDLPDDDEFLARIARADMRTWRRYLRPVMVKFHDIHDGRWTQKKLLSVRKHVESRSCARRRAAEARWRRIKEMADADALHVESKSNASKTKTISKKERSKKKVTPSLRDGAVFTPPDWVPSTAWQGFVAMRNSIRAPLTPHAMHLIVNALERFRLLGDDAGAVLDQSTANSWRGVFRLRDNGGSDPAQPRKSRIISLKDIDG